MVRTQALATQLRSRGAQVVFLTRNPENITSFKTVSVPENLSFYEDAAYDVYVSQKMAAGLLVVDSYAVDQEALDRIAKSEIVSVYIDDLNRYIFDVDYVINGNLYAPQLNYRGKAHFLLGPDYILMRDEFYNTAYHFNKDLRHIMISFGAADVECVTKQVIELIKDYNNFSDLEWHVIIGPANPHGNEIVSMVKSLSNIHLYNSPNMKAIMEKSDLCFSAAGSTVYELAACGVPSLLIITAGNQLMLAEEADRSGFAINMGWHHKISAGLLYRNLDSLSHDFSKRELMIQKGRHLIDGGGARRAAEVLIAEF